MDTILEAQAVGHPHDADVMLQAAYSVLLVDDDPMILKILERKLRSLDSAGVRFDAAASFELGLAGMRSGKYDAFLVDVGLGGRTGIDLIREARAEGIAAPMIVLTGSENPELDRQALVAGASDFLSKDDLDPVLLERTIRFLVENGRKDQQLRMVDARLRSLQDQLLQSEKLESIGRLAAGIAHDLRNPLSVIRIANEFLLGRVGEENSVERKVLLELGAGLDRAERISSELLELSSPRALDPSPEPLKEIVTSALIFVQHLLRKEHIECSLHCEENVSEVTVDRNKVIQVLINLLDNARHAMSEGGRIRLEIAESSLEALPEGQRRLLELMHGRGNPARVVVLRLKDSGSGIPSDKLSQIFKPFYTTKPEGVGTGLGLDISRSILRQHGGELDLCNNPEGGACATLLFPLSAPATDDGA